MAVMSPVTYPGLIEAAARVVSGWPLPTHEQLQRIAAILNTRSGAT